MFNLLAEHWRPLGLERFGPPSRFSWLLVASPTLRHGATRHVVLLLLDRASRRPVLVGKMPRTPGDDLHLVREIVALRAAQAARPSGFDSIPRVVTEADLAGATLLVETAIDGAQMTPSRLHRRFDECAAAVSSWLIDFHQATMDPRGFDVEALVERPLQTLAPLLVQSSEDERLAQRTLDCVRALRGADVPAVFDHGDLYYPNILLRDGGIGVLDWETGEPRGLPAGDLLLFFGCAAFARAGAGDDYAGVEPFDEAFFPLAAWARPFVRRYVEALGLDREWLTPLFVACFARFVLMKAARMVGAGISDLESLREGGALAYLAGELHQLRDYRQWRHAVRNIDRLRWNL